MGVRIENLGLKCTNLGVKEYRFLYCLSICLFCRHFWLLAWAGDIMYVFPGTCLSQIKYAHADFNQIMEFSNNLAEKSITWGQCTVADRLSGIKGDIRFCFHWKQTPGVVNFKL